MGIENFIGGIYVAKATRCVADHCDLRSRLLESLAQNKPLKKINWGMTALSAAMWIPWIAKDAKIYEKNGLDVEIVLLRGSGQSRKRCWAAACSQRRWRCRR